jgi:hypothetical protein
VPFILVSCKKQLVNTVSGNNESLLQELYETKVLVHSVDSKLVLECLTLKWSLPQEFIMRDTCISHNESSVHGNESCKKKSQESLFVNLVQIWCTNVVSLHWSQVLMKHKGHLMVQKQ